MDKTIIGSKSANITNGQGSAKKASQVLKARSASVATDDTITIPRRFTKAGHHPLDGVDYRKASSKIKDTDGRTVFEMKDVEVPAGWSQLAVDILVSKYFRKAGVPGTNHEISVRQVIRRVARTIRVEGEKAGYFSSADAQSFEDELSFMLISQMGAFNSPVWFNCGLHHEYGIGGSGGNFYWDARSMRVVETKDAYSHPQCSACFILGEPTNRHQVVIHRLNEASRALRMGVRVLRLKWSCAPGNRSARGVLALKITCR